MKSISITRKKLEENIEFLGYNHKNLKEDETDFEIISRHEVLDFLNRFETLKQENAEHKRKVAEFSKASKILGNMIDFKASPIKSGMKVMDIMNKPEKYQEELAPILELFQIKEA